MRVVTAVFGLEFCFGIESQVASLLDVCTVSFVYVQVLRNDSSGGAGT